MTIRNPYFGRWMADCLIVFVSFLTTLTYFNFSGHHFYHPGHFGGAYAAILSAFLLIVSAIDLIHTFRLSTRWQKEHKRPPFGSLTKDSKSY